MSAKFDKDICIITFAAALALGGASLLAPISSARAADGVHPAITTHVSSTPAGSIGTVASTPAGAIVDEDGDGDELMEHWSDPKDIREQRCQLAGMLVMFLLTAGVVVRQKLNLRRLARG